MTTFRNSIERSATMTYQTYYAVGTVKRSESADLLGLTDEQILPRWDDVRYSSEDEALAKALELEASGEFIKVMVDEISAELQADIAAERAFESRVG